MHENVTGTFGEPSPGKILRCIPLRASSLGWTATGGRTASRCTARTTATSTLRRRPRSSTRTVRPRRPEHPASLAALVESTLQRAPEDRITASAAADFAHDPCASAAEVRTDRGFQRPDSGGLPLCSGFEGVSGIL